MAEISNKLIEVIITRIDNSSNLTCIHGQQEYIESFVPTSEVPYYYSPGAPSSKGIICGEPIFWSYEEHYENGAVINWPLCPIHMIKKLEEKI